MTSLERMFTGLSNLVMVQPSKEWVFESWVDPKLVVGLGKQHPAVKFWSTMIGGMESAEGSPSDKLDCCEGILEPACPLDQVEEATALREPSMGNDVTDSCGLSTLGDSEVLLIQTKL